MTNEGVTCTWCPFFTVEFKAPKPSGGNPWVAANQRVNASAENVKDMEKLIRIVMEYTDEDIARSILDNLCYSLAVNNNIARLYLTWMDGTRSETYIQLLETFVLSSKDRIDELQKNGEEDESLGAGGRAELYREY